MSLREESIRKIINTCYLWREDGPLIMSLREALKSQASSD
jgi:hypothetical protein